MSKKPPIERAAIYYRYSSMKDAQVENSQQRQEDDVKRYCIKKEWTIEWRGGDDAVSGDKHKPQLMELKRAVEEKQIAIDVVVVATWARLTRKEIIGFQEDVAWIKNAGIRVAIQQEDRVFDLDHDMQELTYKIAEAANYLKRLSSNVRSGQETKFRRGELGYGRPPFGFDKGIDGKWIPNEDLTLVKQMFETFVSTSVIACVPIMRKAKRYQESGKAPSATAVKTVLRNTIYIGYRTFGVDGTGRHGTVRGEVTSGSRNVNRMEESALAPVDVRHEITPTVDDELFFKAQKILDENKKRRPRRETAKYKYSGFVRCSCGVKFVADKRKNHIHYVCPRSKNLKAGCDIDVAGRKTLLEGEITSMVKELSNVILRDTDFHQAVLSNIVDSVNRKMIARGVNGVDKLRNIQRLEERKAKIWKSMIDLSDEDFEAAQHTVKSINERIELERESLSQEEVELEELLGMEFEETEWDVTGKYLNSMITLAKEIAEDEKASNKLGDLVMPDGDVLPVGLINKVNRVRKLSRRVKGQVKKIIKGLMNGKDQTPLTSLIDEITVSFRKIDGRCRPYKVGCTWKVNAAKSTINLDKQDEFGFSQRLKTALYGGTNSTTVVRIVFYPTWKKAFAWIERA